MAKSDRVARDINIYFYYQGALLRKNIELISITEDFGQCGVFAKMLKAGTLTCAEMERENINKRTSGGRAIKARQGGYSGGRPPYGYIVANHALQIEPTEAEVVRKVFELKDGQGYTFQEVCDYLNDRGYTTKSGTKFAISTIQVILGNRKLYEGKYKYGKNSEWVQGVHEPILTPENDPK